jgi:tetratricopeptide (TPR) repeat protein
MKIERNASRQPSLVSSTPRMILSRKVVMMTSGIRRWAPLLLVVLVVATGCTRSPEARKARYLERGDAYFKKEQYREAVIEYWNVLRLDQNHPRAIAQIGLAHFQLGEAAQAFRFLLRAQELTPDDPEVRLKLGTIYLMARKSQEATDEAEAVLAKNPGSLDALVLLANAADSPEEIAAALARLEAARGEHDGRARFHLALGTLYLRQRQPDRAVEALERAVAREPKSVEAHVALGSFYTIRRDAGRAEEAFKRAAELAPPGSGARLRLVDFYLASRRPDEAKRLLAEMTKAAPDYLPAWRRQAELALSEQRYDDSLKAVAIIMKKSPQDLDGRVLRGRIHLAKRETTLAIQEFQEVLKREPKLAPARFQLAQAYLQGGNVQQAKTELKEATSSAPSYVEATLELARLNIQSGATQLAIEDLAKLIQKEPQVVQAYILLGTAHMARREPKKAEEAYRRLVAVAPKDARGPDFVGLTLVAQGKLAEARREFEASLTLAPGFVDPLAHLVRLDLREKKPEVALERVQRQIARVPQSAGLHQLLGRLHQTRRETPQAEAAYSKAIELEPQRIGPYFDLARLYASTGRLDQGLARAEEALKLNPKSQPVLMLVGMLSEAKRDYKRAMEAYEQLLAGNPRFAPAANNLAYRLSETGGDKERALQLAQTAKEAAPDDPQISDTLGWILHQRGVHQRAVVLLDEAATKLPDNAVVRYHLGMAQLAAGNKDAAKRELQEALKLQSGFPGADEARRALSQLP